MDTLKLKRLYELFSSTLFEDIILSWLKHLLDKEYGGYLLCLDRDGSILSTDSEEIWIALI